jgi:hypothetical protein
MRSILLAAGAAIVTMTGAFAASADDDHYYNDDGYYYQNPPSYDYQNRPGYDSGGSYNAYGNPIPPHWIVQNLERSDYRYISRPVLSGRFYQVKAVNPDGHKVKLYIDAYTGQIVKVKG